MRKEAGQQTYEQKTLGMRVFAQLYFPLQYFVVRTILFGLVIQPTPADVIRALNIDGIIDIVRDLLGNFGDVINVEHFAFLFFNFIPYAARIAWLLLPAGLYVYAFWTLAVYFAAQCDIWTHNRHVNPDAHVHVRIGQPGSGKSSTAGYDAVQAAAQAWETLRWKYWLMRNQVADYIRAGDTQRLLEWYEVRDSYEFYATHDCVPCLWANIPMMVKGQNVNVLTYEHAAQIDRIPYHSVLYFDEIGSLFRLGMSTKKVLTVSDFFRLCRHAGQFVVYCTEQEKSNVYVDIRRVVAENRYMLSQRWVNVPWVLLLPYRFMRWLLIHLDPDSKRMAILMQRYYSLIRHIGQRKYVYVNQGNEILGGSPETEQSNRRGRIRKVVMFLPPQLNYQYDDRTFRNLYLAKDKPLTADIFPSLIIDDTPENMERYLKSTEPTAWQDTNKRGTYKRAEKKAKDKSKKAA